MSVSIQGAFLARRMRRMRKHDFSRRLMAENQISVNDLIYPMFILMGKDRRETVESMPVSNDCLSTLCYKKLNTCRN